MAKNPSLPQRHKMNDLVKLVGDKFQLSVPCQQRLQSALLAKDLLASDAAYGATATEIYEELINLAGKFDVDERVLFFALQKQQDKNDPRFDKIKQKMDASAKGKAVFEALIHSTDAVEIDYQFKRNATDLTAFIKSEHTKMLASPVNQAHYQRIMKGFRYVLQNMLKVADDANVANSPKQSLKDTMQKYEKALTQTKSFSQRHFDRFFVYPFTNRDGFHEGHTSGVPSYAGRLLISIGDFRKDYLLHFKQDKIKQKLKEANKSNLVKNVLDLEHTFFHGTNGGIFVNLPQTEYALIASGKLTKMNVVPFSGELGVGATKNGHNHTQLSGTSIEGIHYAKAYSQDKITFNFNGERLRFNFETEKEAIKAFILKLNNWIKEKEDKEQPLISGYFYMGTTPSELANLTYTLRRMDSVIEDKVERQAFNELKKSLLNLTDKLLMGVYEFKQTSGYRYYKNSSDQYYYQEILQGEEALKDFKKELSLQKPRSTVSHHAVNAMQMPLVFASNSIRPDRFYTTQLEWTTQRNLQLGEDIQTLYTDTTANKRKINKWLKEHKLDKKIKVRFISALDEAQLASDSLGGYFADIISLKKLKVLAAQQDALLTPRAIGTSRLYNKLKDSKNKIVSLYQKASQLPIAYQSTAITWSAITLGAMLLTSVSIKFSLLIGLLGYSFNSFTQFFRYGLTHDYFVRDYDNKRVKFSDKSREGRSYLYGRAAQKSWLHYGLSLVDPRAYYLPSYYVGMADEFNQVDPALRIKELSFNVSDSQNKVKNSRKV
ncbi:MAG: hypothetical protein AB7V32_01585 [Candidatus Berkiella sp.]